VSDSIGVALISSGAGIIIAFIGAWASSSKAVAAAVAPLNTKIEKLQAVIRRMRKHIERLGGDPDEDIEGDPDEDL
jgi:hypothetical protein